MKITKKHNNGLTAFQELELGDIFLYHDTYYIRTEYHILSKGGNINAVNIQTGNLAYFRTEEVKKVEAEMIVEV